MTVLPLADPPLVALDANALDRTGTAQDDLVERFRSLILQRRCAVFLPRGVVAEMRHPRAPDDVRDAARDDPPPLSGRLSARQQIDRIRVRAILRGDGRSGKHDADASHLSEAAEAGCRAFITRDGKILRKRDTLRAALPATLAIETLAEFLCSFEASDCGPDHD